MWKNDYLNAERDLPAEADDADLALDCCFLICSDSFVFTSNNFFA